MAVWWTRSTYYHQRCTFVPSLPLPHLPRTHTTPCALSFLRHLNAYRLQPWAFFAAAFAHCCLFRFAALPCVPRVPHYRGTTVDCRLVLACWPTSATLHYLRMLLCAVTCGATWAVPRYLPTTYAYPMNACAVVLCLYRTIRWGVVPGAVLHQPVIGAAWNAITDN